MKRTLENIIKVLDAMEENSRQLKESYKEKGDQKWYELYKRSQMEIFSIKCMLEDKEMFDSVCRIYKIKEEN